MAGSAMQVVVRVEAATVEAIVEVGLALQKVEAKTEPAVGQDVGVLSRPLVEINLWNVVFIGSYPFLEDLKSLVGIDFRCSV